MPDTPNGRANLAGLRAEFHALAAQVQSIGARLETFTTDIYAKLDAHGRPNVTAWLAGAALMLSLGTAVLGAGAVWTSQRITPVEHDIARVDRSLEKAVKLELDNDRDLRTEIKEARLERREELRIIRDEARAERSAIIAEFKEVRNAIVPRGEHEQRWAAQSAAVLAIDRRLDETRKQLSDISSPQDAFRELQRQITELRHLVINGKAKPE